MLNISTQTTKLFIPLWNGNAEDENPISIEILRMPFGDFIALTGILEQLQAAYKTRNQKTTASTVEGLISELKPLMERNTRNLLNIIVDQKPAAISHIIDQPGLMGLTMEIVSELVRFNSLDDQIKKKSPLQSDAENPGSINDGSGSFISVTSGNRTGPHT